MTQKRWGIVSSSHRHKLHLDARLTFRLCQFESVSTLPLTNNHIRKLIFIGTSFDHTFCHSKSWTPGLKKRSLTLKIWLKHNWTEKLSLPSNQVSRSCPSDSLKLLKIFHNLLITSLLVAQNVGDSPRNQQDGPKSGPKQQAATVANFVEAAS